MGGGPGSNGWGAFLHFRKQKFGGFSNLIGFKNFKEINEQFAIFEYFKEILQFYL